MRCVPRDLTYHVYAAAPRALRIRTRVLVGGTSSASFHGARRTDCSVSGGLRAVRTPGVLCVCFGPVRLADENPRFSGRNLVCGWVQQTKSPATQRDLAHELPGFLCMASSGKVPPYPSKSTSSTSMDSMRSRSSWREWTLSFLYTWLMWVLAVPSEMTSSSMMWFIERPLASR